jgi:hypothetical protein
MAMSTAWRLPHEEAIGELGPIRVAERMPPKTRWLAIFGTVGIFLVLLSLLVWWLNAAPPPALPPGPQAKKAAGERAVGLVLAGISAVFGVFFAVVGYLMYRSFMTGSYSLHERGALSIVWGKVARQFYQDIDELTMRAQRVYVNGAYIGEARWVTMGATTVGGASVRLCHVKDGSSRPNYADVEAVILEVSGELATRIAAQIDKRLAQGETYPLTSTLKLTSEGVLVGKGAKERPIPWAELGELKVQGGMCFLYQRGEKKPVATWLCETKNCIPVSMIMQRRLSSAATGVA